MNAKRAKYIADYLNKCLFYNSPDWAKGNPPKNPLTPQVLMLADRAWKNRKMLQPVAQENKDGKDQETKNS